MGPVHYVVVAFDHPDFHGPLAAELAALVDSQTLRLLDLVFISKDAAGEVTTLEVDGLPEGDAYRNVDGEFGGLVSEEDLAAAAEQMEPDSAGALLIWENTWARRFVAAIAEAGGRVVDQGLVPDQTVTDAVASLQAQA